MLPHLSARQSWKAMKDKYQKQSSTLKELKFFQQALTTLLGSGMSRAESSSKCSRDTKTRYSLASSTMRAILSSQDQKTTPAKFGETKRPSKSLNQKNDSLKPSRNLCKDSLKKENSISKVVIEKKWCKIIYLLNLGKMHGTKAFNSR